MVLCITAPILQAITDKTVTAVAEEYVRVESRHLHGIIVREELIIGEDAHPFVPIAADGQAVAAGAQVAVSGDHSIFTPSAGIYVHHTDGYENLSPSYLSDITPVGVDMLLGTKEHMTESSAGKVITDHAWLIAATTDTDTAAHLQENRSVTLYPDGLAPISSTVIHISPPENGRCAVVFRCTAGLLDTLALRELTIEIQYSHTEGLSIPKQALLEEENDSFVYVLSAGRAEKRAVHTLLEDGDTIIISKSPSLQAGDIIIVSAPKLREGLLIQEGREAFK